MNGVLDTPIQFCALLECLIERSIPVDRIIQSGLLHRYFEAHSSQITDIQRVYELLASRHCLDSLAQQLFLLGIRGFQCGMTSVFPDYALDGQRADGLKPIVVVRPTYSWAVDKENFDNLMQLFGMNFLEKALLKPREYPHPILNESLRSKLVSLSLSEITGFYRYINTSIAGEHRQPLLMQLNQYITDDVALTLLNNHDVSLWSLLKVRPNLIVLIDFDMFKSKIASMKEDEIGLAFDVANSDQPPLDELRQDIYMRIADIKSRNPGLPIDPSILTTLKANEAVQVWVKEKADDYKKTLCLQMNDYLRAEFTTDSYQVLSDFMNAMRPSYRSLQDMSNNTLDLPMNNHARDGWILTMLYQSSDRLPSAESLNKALEIMVQRDEYTLEEKNQWKGCILLASLYQPLSDSALHDFLWNPSNGFIQLWSHALRSDNIGRVLASTCVETFKSRLEAVFGDLVRLKGKGAWLGNVMRYLNEEQCKLFLDALKDSLSTSILDDSHELSLALRCLNTEKSRLLLAAVKNDIKNYEHLIDVLQSLDIDKCHLLLEEVKGTINTIVMFGSQLGQVLYILNEEKCRLFCDVLQEKLSKIIPNVTKLIEATSSLSETKYQLLLNVLHVYDIIKDGNQLIQALGRRHSGNQRILINRLRDDLHTIIKNSTQLGAVIGNLETPLCSEVLDVLKDNLSTLIPDVNQLCAALRASTDQGKGRSSIQNNAQRVASLPDRDSAFTLLIEHLEDQLPALIKTELELHRVLTVLEGHPDPIKLVLEAIKGRLPTLTRARGGEQLTQDTIRNAIKESHHRWFNSARASTINVGSLKHKLEGYIEAKQRECSLHFDFLYLKCFIGWILGYNARDEKVSAAQYILDVINNQEDTQRDLTPIMRQSLEHGLLGDIVKGHGGVDRVLDKYRLKNRESQGLSDIARTSSRA